MATDSGNRAPFLSWSFWAASVDGRGLLRLRVGLGVLVAVSAIRMLANGWVDSLYVAPNFHFHYDGFSWVQAFAAPWMHLVVGSLVVLGLAMAAGVGRWATVACAVVFTYVELIDKATYLNHYYLVSVLLVLVSLTSVNRTPVVKLNRSATVLVPRYALWAIRAQVALVYFFAGLWKLNADWLLRAEPLSTWLWSFQGTPVVGTALASAPAGYFMAWAGAAFDLSIWAFLLWRSTSRAAFVVCICFHMVLWLMFPIGVFSFVMILAASTLLPPARRSDASDGEKRHESPKRSKAVAVVLVVIIVGQLLFPLRSLAFPGDVNWNERGYRFSWRVMLNEKAANTTFDVEVDGARTKWPLLAHLTPLQRRQMGFQPDMILQYAHHICDTLGQGGQTVVVKARADVAWNRRRAHSLVKPVDLCRVHSIESVVLPRPQANPPKVGPTR